MPTFLQDYLIYNSGNECSRNYHIWSALVTVAATTGRRVSCRWGYFDIHPNLYVVLVGKQGFRKSTAKDIARDMFAEACPNIPIGASVQSREDIVKFMASEACLRAYTDETGSPIEYRPIVFFVNELKNFLSIDPGKMIEFMTDIYDRKFFDASTIKHGLQKIVNPCVNFLACETPVWIIDKLKSNIISGGFARRVIYVYETTRGPRITFPTITDEAKAARERCILHLQKLPEICGEFVWTAGAREFYNKWYQGIKPPEDEVMAGYYESKHIQMLKVAMCLALMAPVPKLELTEELLRIALVLLDEIEINMPKLSVAAGRNELAIPQQRIMELLQEAKGFMREKQLKILLGKDLTPMEQMSLLTHLTRETGQLTKAVVYRNGTPFTEIWLTDAFNENVKSKRLTHEDGKILWQNANVFGPEKLG
jgi:hypothetical protein